MCRVKLVLQSSCFAMTLGYNCLILMGSSQMSATTYDDTDPRITYSPAGTAWSTNTGSDFMNNSLQFVQTVILRYGHIADQLPPQLYFDGRRTGIAFIHGRCCCNIWHSFTRPCQYTGVGRRGDQELYWRCRWIGLNSAYTGEVFSVRQILCI